MDTYFKTFYQESAGACVDNITPPTFAGIDNITANNDGSFTVDWTTATGTAANPIRYRIYISVGSVSAATLFAITNYFVSSTGTVSARLYADPLGAVLIAGSVYTIGVRAESAVGVIETNTAILTDTLISNIYTLVSNTQTAATALSQYNSLDADIATIQTTVDAIPTLAEIEASTVLAKEQTSKNIFGSVQ